MTLDQGNENARPDTGEVTVADLATPPAAPQAPQEPSEPEIVDFDLKELREAHAAAKAEEAAAAGQTTAPTEPGPAGQNPTEPKPTAQEPAAQGQPQPQQPSASAPMIPKPRFDEVLSERDRAAQDAAYWRGVAEARGQAPSPGQPPQQPQQTPEQRIAALHQNIDALATRFDNGEITMSEYTRQQRELTTQEQAIRDEALAAKLKPANQPAPKSSSGDELYLDTLTGQLEAAHPWVAVFDRLGQSAEPEWNYLLQRATDVLIQKGIDPGSGKIATYELRKEVARLADELGPSLIGARAQAQGISLPGSPSPQQPNGQVPNGKPALSSTAQARQTKLQLQNEAPPNLQALTGAPGNATGEPTAAQLEAMSDEDIGKLPDSIRRKLLGVS
jgi:hypothetical protein